MMRIANLRPADLGALLVATVAGLLAVRLLVSLVVGIALAMLPRHRARPLRAAWSRHAAPLARRLLAVALPVTLAGAGALPAGAAVIRRAYGPPWQGPVTAARTATRPPAAPADTTHRSPAGTPVASEPTTASTSRPTTAATGPQPSTPHAPPRTTPTEHTVGRGESFWSIAESHVLLWLDEATERDLARYWVRLVEANADRLPVRGDPDLLLPGTVLRLPPLTR